MCVLNYIATSNHVHLLVVNTEKDVIAKNLQLVAGRTAQEFNQRKKRKGAFWEDRYHATAVETDEHLAKCIVYIDLNMVRAGVVRHPSEYRLSGFNEIQNPPKRYSVIDRKALLKLFSIDNQERFQQQLGLRVKGRSVVSEKEGTVLKEASAPYNALFEGEKSTLRPDNSYFIDLNASNPG